MSDDHARRSLIIRIRAHIARTAGRTYTIDLEALDLDSLRDMERLLRDLDYDRRRDVEQARIFPWRRQ